MTARAEVRRPGPPPNVPAFTRSLTLGSRYACPKCGKLRFDTVPRSGDLFDACQRRDCNQPWWVLVLPGGATYRDLLDSLTPKLARRVLDKLARNPFAPPDTPLLDPDLDRKRTFLFLTIEKHQRHRLLFADLEDVLATAGIHISHTSEDRNGLETACPREVSA